ncbi:MAG: cell wall hydrolase [Eubacterium sp.]|nr:cell wall hydrolase [Eubacterium sp.]
MMYEEGYGDSVLLVFFRDDEYGLINRSEYVRAVNLYLNNNLSDMKELLREKKKKNDNLLQLKNNREGIQQSLMEEQEELKAGLQELEDLIRETELEADDAEALAEALQLQVIEEEERRKAQAMMNSKRYTYAEIVDSDGTDYYQAAPYIYTDDELKLLAAIIEAEAGNVCYEGMIAVGSVVMNRVDSPDFPDTIAGIIYAPYQFEPAETGSLAIILAKNPANLSYMAAEEVLNGTRNVPNLYFKAKWYAEENGISGVNIGGNVFH